MNYLAHAHLSFNHVDILIGNFISDFVKGKDKFNFTKGVQSGIMLHRAIDTFTDENPIIKEAKKIFQPAYRLYSGAFIDVVMDYYLAQQLLKEMDLKQYTEGLYQSIAIHQAVFPPTFQKMFPSMQEHNWLYNYQFKWGIEKSLIGLQRRAKYITEVDTAYQLFLQHDKELGDFFNDFWPQLYEFAEAEYKIHLNALG
jgi:acyl carrier protein phosphodiesterase